MASNATAEEEGLPAHWELARYLSIPIIASLIGYFTNVLAIVMTFSPLEYFGFGEGFFHRWGFSLGWQGIIPANVRFLNTAVAHALIIISL